MPEAGQPGKSVAVNGNCTELSATVLAAARGRRGLTGTVGYVVPWR
jgi:hypothetical protein